MSLSERTAAGFKRIGEYLAAKFRPITTSPASIATSDFSLTAASAARVGNLVVINMRIETVTGVGGTHIVATLAPEWRPRYDTAGSALTIGSQEWPCRVNANGTVSISRPEGTVATILISASLVVPNP